jgi:hypothetical protein
MEKESQPKSQPLTPTMIITLLVGFMTVAVSLYIFYESRSRPAVEIDQQASITYASTKSLSSLGDVRLSVNGSSISDLTAIPFRITNTGNVPLSSIPNSPSFNLSGFIPIEFQSTGLDKSIIQIFVIQTSFNDTTRFKASFENRPTGAIVKIDMKSLNVGDFINFTVLVTGYTNQIIRVPSNPLIGGVVTINLASGKPASESVWERFKSVWISIILGIIFLSQFPIILFIVINEAFKYSHDRKQKKLLNEFRLKSDVINALESRKKRIKDHFQEKINSIDKTLVQQMKITQIEVPPNFSSSPNVENSESIFNLFQDAFDKLWNQKLEEIYPLPEEFDESKVFNNYGSLGFFGFGWSHFLDRNAKKAIFSIVFAIIGFALLYF